MHTETKKVTYYSGHVIEVDGRRYESERTCRYESTNRCTWVCTSCGREADVLHYGYNYCPNCGAKVVE